MESPYSAAVEKGIQKFGAGIFAQSDGCAGRCWTWLAFKHVGPNKKIPYIFAFEREIVHPCAMMLQHLRKKRGSQDLSIKIVDGGD